MKLILAIFWNTSERRLRLAWRLVGTLLVALTVTSVLTVLGLFPALLTVADLILDAGSSVDALRQMPDAFSLTALLSQPQFLMAQAVTLLVATVATLWLSARLVDRRRFASFGLHFGRAWWADLAFGLILGALLMSLIWVAELALGWVRIVGTLHTPRPGQAFARAIVIPLISFVCIGIYEELAIRGYLLRNLAEGLNLPFLKPTGGTFLAWVISSVIFGLLHFQNPNATMISSVYLMLGGLLFGLGYILTGELALPIGLHISWNFFLGAVFGFPVSGIAPGPSFVAVEQLGPDLWTGGAFGPEAGLLGVFATLLGGVLVLAWTRRRTPRATPWCSMLAYERPLARG